MPTKAEMLSKLDEGRLKKIAKSEGLSTIPRTFGKRELVKYLDGTLTAEQVKEYVAEVYEKVTKREIIRETVKERGVRLTAKETSRIKLDRRQLVYDIIHSREKIDKSVIAEIAENLRQPVPKGSGYGLYDKMNEEMLDAVYRIFVTRETDGKGRFLEYRFANFLKRRTKQDISRLEVRFKLPKIGEIDVVGFDAEDKPSFIAECKDRSVKNEDIDKWLSNIKRVYSECDHSLREAYFVGSAGYTQGTIERVENEPNIDPKKGTMSMGGLALVKDFWNRDMSDVGGMGKVRIEIYSERQRQFVRELPRK